MDEDSSTERKTSQAYSLGDFFFFFFFFFLGGGVGGGGGGERGGTLEYTYTKVVSNWLSVVAGTDVAYL